MIAYLSLAIDAERPNTVALSIPVAGVDGVDVLWRALAPTASVIIGCVDSLVSTYPRIKSFWNGREERRGH